jgi:hypothetical protein
VIEESTIEGDVDDERYLLIPKIASPTQRYVCTASNPLGSAKLLFNINVKGSQKQRGGHLYLRCCCLSIQNLGAFRRLKRIKNGETGLSTKDLKQTQRDANKSVYSCRIWNFMNGRFRRFGEKNEYYNNYNCLNRVSTA